MKPALDDIFVEKNSSMLVWIPALVGLVYMLKGACDFGQYYLMSYIGQSIIRDLREQMFVRLEEMSVGFFVRHSTGELLSRMSNDVTLVQGAMTSAITGMVRDAVTVVALIFVVFYRDFTLALIAMLVFPLAIYPLLSFGKKLKRYSRRMLVSLEDITERLNETITGIRIVKAFAMEHYERDRFVQVNNTLFNAFMRRFKVRALSNPMMETLGGFGVCAIVYYGGSQVITGQSTPENVLFVHGRPPDALRAHKEDQRSQHDHSGGHKRWRKNFCAPGYASRCSGSPGSCGSGDGSAGYCVRGRELYLRRGSGSEGHHVAGPGG